MPAKITVGPPLLTINRGSTFMVTDHNGEIDPQQAHGVFAQDTRFVSHYGISINGRPWERINSAAVSYHAARLYFTSPPLGGAIGVEAVPARVLGLEVYRDIDVSLHEHFTITNYYSHALDFVLELELASDFADLFEVKEHRIRSRPGIVTTWDDHAGCLTTEYRHDDYMRRLVYRVRADQRPSHGNGRIRFPVHLEHGESWQGSGEMVLEYDGQASEAGSPRRSASQAGAARRLHERWLESCTGLSSDNDELRHSYQQAMDDMGALRLYESDLGPDVWVPAAGVPWFVALFGRDSLIAAQQALPVHARFAEGALRMLAEYQAADRDDWHDAQPGKIVHEVRCGELARFRLVPHTQYYGTWDATPLYLIVLYQAWRWLGDRRLVEELWPVAKHCLEWIDNWGDLDGDGFQEYRTFSTDGYENMGWKDAGDAVVYPDGSQVRQPKALCELQGYVYAAKLGMAELGDVLGDEELAGRLRRQAVDLKRRFNEAFWMEDEGTYAFGLDPEKRQIKTVVSNGGHCLWAGIAAGDRAERVVRRLVAEDMWSGWGIRTLSSRNPAFDPFSYQRGSVWPHDNAIIAAGFKRAGFAAEANHVARAILEAAASFQNFRLPEVFAGLTREPDSFPVQYLGANIPQAWAAGSIFSFVQTMLGLQADAPGKKLYVCPSLPDWVPNLRLSGLQVGQTRLTLRFWRDGERTRFDVESEEGEEIDVVESSRFEPVCPPEAPGNAAGPS